MAAKDAGKHQLNLEFGMFNGKNFIPTVKFGIYCV